MKTFLFPIIFLVVIIAAKAQGSFSISGSINGLSYGTAKLTYIGEGQNKQFTAAIKNGKFFFKGSLSGPEWLTINFVNDHFNIETSFFIGNENISINVDTANIGNPIIEGSQTQKDFESYRQLIKTVDEKSAALNKTGTQLYVSGKLTERLKDSLFNARDNLDMEKRFLIAGFAREHPASAVSAWAISTFYGYDPILDELVPVFNLLSEKNRHSLYGKQVAEIIEAAKKTAIGRLAPDFTVNDLNGKPVSLSSYKGKYIFVDFWASWCGPCRSENPNIVNMYHKYHSNKFDILGISLDESREAWLKAVNNDNLEWTQLSDLQAFDSKIVAEYRLKGIPFNMLLDKDGRIIARNLRGVALENKLKEVLN